MNVPRFEWDDNKAASNLAKHGIPFEFATRVFMDRDLLVVHVSRPLDKEERLKAIGKIDRHLYAVVHTFRGATCRIISARRASPSERRGYDHHQVPARP